MLILGINAYHGDASAAAVIDGRLVAAAEEERFTRLKHTAGFPAAALRYVADATNAQGTDLRVVAVARNPWARILRKAWYGLRMPRAALTRTRVQHRVSTIGAEVERALDRNADGLEVRRVEHHTAHLASAFFASPFDEAALFSVDGLGDFASAMWGVGRGNRIYPGGVVSFPHSLGILYTALSQYLGFPKYGDEYKVMGLASYGEPEFLDEFRRIVIAPDHIPMRFLLRLAYFTHHRTSVDMTWEHGEPVIGRLYSDYLIKRLGPPRDPSAPIEARHQHIAASLQRRLEEVLLGRLQLLQAQTRLRRLCLAGGVAFNCVANGKITEHTGFDHVYIPPAAGDAGLAIGAALYVWHQQLGQPRGFVMEHAYWGPEFADEALRAALNDRRDQLRGCSVFKIEAQHALCRWTAAQIAAGQVVGWFQGRMEWGPRALGNRSILADPRRRDMRDLLNTKIKRREPFRPFAPSVIEAAASDYFEHVRPSPFMLLALRVRPEKRDVIPATTHVDGTGRLHTVSAVQNPLYYELLTEFERHTGVPVLLNTSFNEHEPVVCTPGEAIDCFVRTEMDTLVLGHWVLTRHAPAR